MANYVSKVKLGGTIYSLKDTEARAAVAALETAVASSLVFKGIVSSAAEITELTNYELGWTYKASSSFTIESIGKIENGDMIICVHSNNVYSPSDWNVVQSNIDIMTGASSSEAGVSGLVPAPKAGDTDKYLRGDGTWGSSPSDIPWGTFDELLTL